MKRFVWILLLSGILFALSAPARAQDKKPILLVISNVGELGNTGKPTGFYLSEASHPWQVFEKAGYEVRLASPLGGFAPVDPKSFDLSDPVNKNFWQNFGKEKNGINGVPATEALGEILAEEYCAIFFAGGHGAMWDFPNNSALQKVTASIYEKGGAVGAVCHGPAALLKVKLANGTYLVSGKKVAPFTDAEEEESGLTTVVPFLLESSLKKNGAIPVPAPNFKENAVLDGRLVTGQNPASATKTAELLVQALGGK